MQGHERGMGRFKVRAKVGLQASSAASIFELAFIGVLGAVTGPKISMFAAIFESRISATRYERG